MSPEATGLTVMCRDRRRTTRPEETSIRTGATVPTTPSVILIPICCSGVAKNNPKYSKMTFLGLGLFVDVIKCGITTHDNYVGSGWSRDQDVGLRLWHWPTCTRRQWQRLAAALQSERAPKTARTYNWSAHFKSRLPVSYRVLMGCH